MLGRWRPARRRTGARPAAVAVVVMFRTLSPSNSGTHSRARMRFISLRRYAALRGV
ncbi:hypothetical protein Y024_5590 [Burkholderia pseudomallei TSV44]|nr:hypothetical protein Y024_5590 [Burkholderia pseudomallei TSV44]